MRLVVSFLLLSAALLPAAASAHEVYVLSPQTIAHDIASPSPNPLGAIGNNKFQFMLWAFVALVLVLTVFTMSITHRLEVFFEPYFRRIKPYAPLVARVTLGLCL